MSAFASLVGVPQSFLYNDTRLPVVKILGAGAGAAGPSRSSSPTTCSRTGHNPAFDPIHYLPLLERKPGALDHAAPLYGGRSLMNSGRCGVCWNPEWDGGVSVSTCR